MAVFVARSAYIFTLVASSHGAWHTSLNNTLNGNGPGLLTPAVVATNRGRDDVATILIGAVVCRDEDIVADGVIAAENTVRTERNAGCSAGEVILVGLRSDDSCLWH